MVLGPSGPRKPGLAGMLAKAAGSAAKAGAQRATTPTRSVGNYVRQGAQNVRRRQGNYQSNPVQGPSAIAGNIGSAAQSFAAPAPEPVAEPVVPPPPPQLSEDDWRAQDSTYLGEQSALDLQLKQALAGLADTRMGYNKDFGGSLRNLGYSWQDGNNNGIPDDDEIKGGSWNKDDLQGAYGQAYQNQTNDFASRGLMDSSLYADAMTEQDRGFTRQFDDMSGARQQYLKQLLGEETGAKDTYAQALAQARASASARRAAEYGL